MHDSGPGSTRAGLTRPGGWRTISDRHVILDQRRADRAGHPVRAEAARSSTCWASEGERATTGRWLPLQQPSHQGSAVGTAVPVDPSSTTASTRSPRVYGPAPQGSHPESSSGRIRSAIDFEMDIERIPDPKGERPRPSQPSTQVPSYRKLCGCRRQQRGDQGDPHLKPGARTIGPASGGGLRYVHRAQLSAPSTPRVIVCGGDGRRRALRLIALASTGRQELSPASPRPPDPSPRGM